MYSFRSFHASAVQIDQSLYQRQAETESAASPIERAVRLRENIENAT